ncbi:hypothetical protein PENTCL1PPCAC_5500, partial [Pristionchus entomophagus]
RGFSPLLCRAPTVSRTTTMLLQALMMVVQLLGIVAALTICSSKRKKKKETDNKVVNSTIKSTNKSASDKDQGLADPQDSIPEDRIAGRARIQTRERRRARSRRASCPYSEAKRWRATKSSRRCRSCRQPRRRSASISSSSRESSGWPTES